MVREEGVVIDELVRPTESGSTLALQNTTAAVPYRTASSIQGVRWVGLAVGRSDTAVVSLLGAMAEVVALLEEVMPFVAAAYYKSFGIAAEVGSARDSHSFAGL